MKTNEKIIVGASLASLGLLFYNTYLNRKQAQLSGALGAIEDVAIDGGTIQTVSSVADSYFHKAYNTFDTFKSNENVQEALKEMGLDVVVKDITLDRAKNILSAYAIFKIMTALKSNAIKIALIGGGVYALNKNKQKLSVAYNELLGDNTTVS